MKTWQTSSDYKVELVSVLNVRRTEEHDNNRVSSLLEKIRAQAVWTDPIIIEKHTGLIMDGHHRLNAGKRLSLKYVPCIKLEYVDERVELGFWRDNFKLQVKDILALKTSGKVLPYKTTRHTFSPAIGRCDIPISLLY